MRATSALLMAAVLVIAGCSGGTAKPQQDGNGHDAAAEAVLYYEAKPITVQVRGTPEQKMMAAIREASKEGAVVVYEAPPIVVRASDEVATARVSPQVSRRCVRPTGEEIPCS